jgi:hypothetical protein
MKWPWQKSEPTKVAKTEDPLDVDLNGWYADVEPNSKYLNYYDVQVYSPDKTKWGPSGGVKSIFATDEHDLRKQVKEHIKTCKSVYDHKHQGKMRIEL